MEKQFFSTVCGRLTISYTLLFGILSFAAFLLVYVHIAHNLNQRTDDRLRATIRELIKTREESGITGLQKEFILESTATGKQRIFFRLFDPKGDLIASSDLTTWKNIENFSTNIQPGKEQILRMHIPACEYPARIITVRLEDDLLLQAGTVDDKDEVLESYRETFSTAYLLILSLGGIGAYLIAFKAMGGVREVTEAAARMAAGDLAQPISKGDRGVEIEGLATMFNIMQKRLAVLIGELKAVVNNVAHDLRMPITRMRGVAETTLTMDADKSSYRDMAVTVIEESDRLVGQINTILELAEIDAGLKVLTMEEVDLAKIVSVAVELYQPAVDERELKLNIQLDRQPLPVNGNLNSLQRLLANLLDNAIKFTPAGGKIDIAVLSKTDNAILTVADNGPGIPLKDKERIFDRFYRGDTSRSISGNGLGLALVKSIVQRHQGTITVTGNSENGSCFIVTLPNYFSNSNDSSTLPIINRDD